MNVFITGATGFVGRHVLRKLLDNGHRVVALRRKASIDRVHDNPKLVWLERSIENLEEKHFVGIDVLVHLAAHSANHPYDSLENCLQANVSDSIKMGYTARRAGISRFVIAGSYYEYGRAGERYEKIPTDAPLEPDQAYPISKAAASLAWSGFARMEGLSLEIVRLFQVYGPGELSTRLWPTLKREAAAGRDFEMSPGEQIRDFVRVESAAAVIATLIHLTHIVPGVPRICHVASGREQSLANFARKAWESMRPRGRLLLGSMPYRKNETMRCVPVVDEEVVKIVAAEDSIRDGATSENGLYHQDGKC